MTLRKGNRRSRNDRAAAVAGPIEALEMRLHLSGSKGNWPWLATSIPALPVNSLPPVAPSRPEMTLAGWLKSQSGSTTAGPASLDPVVNQPIAVAKGLTPLSFSTPPGSALTPAQMKHAYGIDQVLFGSVHGDGTGQTIAIIDAFHYPSAFADLNAFSSQYSLPAMAAYPSTSPWFRQVSQTGGTNYPTNAAIGGWAIEMAMDIEWAHAIAPGANILLVEASSASNASLIQAAANWARKQPGVVAVSMSFGALESSPGLGSGETSYDTNFTTWPGHTGVTFLASTGDSGQPGSYPAYSPNVVAVGGTTLNLSGGNYSSEVGWSGSGGGISSFESRPAWQNGVVTQTPVMRATPDVAMEADPSTGIAIYDSYDFGTSAPWGALYGGTSLSSPMWAGLMALTAQGRALAGLTPLDGATQTLPALYGTVSGLPVSASDFHDITTGNNGFAAGTGYDLVTGLGTPKAATLINNLSGVGSIAGTVYDDRNGNGVNDAGDLPVSGATVYLDANNNGVLDTGVSANASATGLSVNIPDNNSTGATTSLTISGMTAPITDVNMTLSITDSRLSDLTGYLTSPDNTTITLFTGLSGANLTSTTFDDQAATAIAAGTAPYNGTFRAAPGVLAAFNNKSGTAANGTWKLNVIDNVNGQTGTITAWSLSISGAEQTSTTGADGKYMLSGTAYGTQVVREVAPSGYVQVVPTPPQGRTATVAGNLTGQDFGDAVPGSISGEVFTDTNGNGTLNAGETGLAGWKVYVDSNGNGAFDTGEPSQTSAADGSYSLTGLSPGTYTVRIVLQAGYQTTTPAGGSYSVSILSGTTTTGKNFGSFQLGSIAGQVFTDSNGNGTLNAGEPGLAGWIVYVDANNNGNFDGGETYRVTDANGAYSFTGLGVGTYILRVVQQGGYQATSPAGGSNLISVQSGTVSTADNFGNFQPGSISGVVFADTNGNGALDAGEAGLAGWKAYLDSNGNGVFDTGEPSQFTAADGSYSFTGLSAATYHVRIVPQTGYQTTAPAGGLYSVAVTSGMAATAQNFGTFQLGSIAGEVFTDTNGNGTLDASENGLAGWTVYLDVNSNGVLDAGDISQTSAANGTYSFTGLSAGTYTVRMVSQAGYQSTSPAAGLYAVTVTSGTAVTHRNFGNFQPGSIAGTVYGDTDGNGQLNGNETGVSGWTVYLDTNGDGVRNNGEPSQVTAANGGYTFTGLSAGAYTVRVEEPAGYQTTGPAGGSYSVAIQSGTAASGNNFGSFQQGIISGEVFADTNGNGQLDAGESGLTGWIVYQDANGNGKFDGGEPYSITDANGGYSFSGLGVGTYVISVVPHAGYQPTGPAGGTYSVPVQSGTVGGGKNFGQQAISSGSGTPNLTLASDTGIFHTDLLTQLNNSASGQALQFSVANTVPGATITLYANGQPIGSAVATATTTVVATNGTTVLADGPHTFTATQTEPGKTMSAASPGQIVTILTAKPAAPLHAPALAPGSDTGVSASDNITANLTPTFISDAAPWFRLYRNGVQISGDYQTATYTTGTQSNGTSNFTVTAVDAAGNESSPSPAVAVTFDTTAPSATIDPTASNPVAGAVDPMQIAFTKATYGFDLSHLSLSRDGFDIPLTAAMLTTTDQINFSLADLAGLTALPGTYVLSATNTGVTDAAGNAMANSPIQTWTNTLLAGTSGDDQVTIVRDAANSALADVNVNVVNNPAAGYSFQLRSGNLPQFQVGLGAGNDTLTVDFSNGNPLPAGQTTYDGGTGNNVLAVVSPPGGNALTAEPGRFLFNTTPIDLTGVGSVMPISSDGKDTLTIAAGTSLKLASLPYKTLFVSGLTIAADSSLDLADNGLVLAYGASSPLAQLTQDIVNGRDGLSGAKLLTTATAARPSALGLVDNQMLHLSTWAGRQIDDGTHHQIIVKFTYVGDVNLDGQVTQDDLYNVFANQGGSGGWFAGDVNLDGVIDTADLQIVLGNMDAGTGGVNGQQL